jgi:predicted glycosyltransferase
MTMRVAMYWHNGRSLGHTAETAKVAHALAGGVPHLSLAGVTGAYRGLDLLPAAMDVFKLPSYADYDLAAGWHATARQGVTVERLFAMRTELIDVFLRHYAPHILLVNHLPYGAAQELAPALTRAPIGRRVLTLRGVLFDREKTNGEYFSPASTRWIDQHFDAIYVHTDPRVFRLEEYYTVPPVLRERIRYLGYLAEESGVDRTTARRELGLEPGERLIVASMGGGQGTLPIWLAIVAALDSLRDRFDRAVVVTGPYLEADDGADLRARVADLSWLELHSYVSGLPAWMSACDLFLGAAGSSTLGEILAARCNAVVIPRQVREPEQRIHAQILAGRNLVRLCDLPDLLSGRLAPVLAQALAEPLRPGPGVALNGARQYPRLLAELLR